ncbi:hypothetical protein [Nostoc sp. DSM 114167]|uniref:hypothetical protein n=1 Tax=Nostoc sp. DSM 114167 TaxID=3439050 RepID=UPI0040459741
MITGSVQKSQKSLSPSKNCPLNNKSSTGHDMTAGYAAIANRRNSVQLGIVMF